jgi:hypothetical protein
VNIPSPDSGSAARVGKTRGHQTGFPISPLRLKEVFHEPGVVLHFKGLARMPNNHDMIVAGLGAPHLGLGFIRNNAALDD